jgi:hypothetical protein
MGWGESPPFVCAATETARDIAQENLDNNNVMAPQPMEKIMMDIDWATVPLPAQLPASENDKQKFLSVLEVYTDDFIGLIQSTNTDHLLQFSRTILSAISNVFPSPEITNSSMGPAVSVKKLVDEGTRETRKEILGWLFDGIARTIKLPENKGRTIRTKTKRLIRSKSNQVHLNDFQKVHGKLQFSSFNHQQIQPTHHLRPQIDGHSITLARTRSICRQNHPWPNQHSYFVQQSTGGFVDLQNANKHVAHCITNPSGTSSPSSTQPNRRACDRSHIRTIQHHGRRGLTKTCF